MVMGLVTVGTNGLLERIWNHPGDGAPDMSVEGILIMLIEAVRHTH